MYSQEEINGAVAAGALAPEQAASLRDYVAASNRTPTADEEYLWFFRGYNDAFVAYACIAVLGTLGWLGTMIPVGDSPRGGMGGFPMVGAIAALLVATASWGLAEIFSRLRRMALPSFLLALTFPFAVLVTLMMLILPMAGRGAGMTGGGLLATLCAAVAAIASYFFWRRFRVPFSQAMTVGMGVAAIAILFGSLLGRTSSGGNVVLVLTMLMGIGVFVYAMRWDMGDPWRVTMRSDVGFWLHWLAAALVIYPLMVLLGVSAGIGSAGSAIVMIIIFLLAALIGLVVNRKIWVAFSLMPLAYSINSLLQGGRSRRDYDDFGEGFGASYSGGYGSGGYGSGGYGRGGYGGGSGYGANPSNPFGGTELLMGTFWTLFVISLIMLLLAIFWSPVRRMVVGILPAGLQARLGSPVRHGPPEQPYAGPDDRPL